MDNFHTKFVTLTCLSIICRNVWFVLFPLVNAGKILLFKPGNTGTTFLSKYLSWVLCRVSIKIAHITIYRVFVKWQESIFELHLFICLIQKGLPWSYIYTLSIVSALGHKDIKDKGIHKVTTSPLGQAVCSY